MFIEYAKALLRLSSQILYRHIPLHMNIAVDIGLSEHTLWDINGTTSNLFFSLAKQQPYHYFIFFSSKPVTFSEGFSENMEVIIINSKRNHLPIVSWWSDFKIAIALKKNKADVFISANVFRFIPGRLKILMINELTYFYDQSGWFEKKRIKKSVCKAEVICTTTQYLKLEIEGRFNVQEDKIWNVGSFAKPIYKPLAQSSKEIIKEAYAEGYEYFLFLLPTDTDESFHMVLKAYSLFKKWQRTNMKLLVIQKVTSRNNVIIEKLKTFKYREDVKMLSNLPDDEMARVLAAAYAFIFPSDSGGGVPVLQALQCEVPVITLNLGSVAEIGGDTVLYADNQNPNDIAEQMKIVYKDEQLRNKLIALGKERAEEFNLQKTSALMWKAVQQAVSQ